MNHYLPPQARLQTDIRDLNDNQRMSIWNTSTTPAMPSYYSRQQSLPSPTQTAMTAQSWRVISPPKAISPPKSISPPKPSFTGPVSSLPSVKHLTCYFWAKHGACKWSDEDCLYAHYITGKIANGPLQVEPGRPAVAGRNATNPRPVYGVWRSGQCNPHYPNSHHPGMGPHSMTIEPAIQEQINYIAAKERARSASNSNSNSNSSSTNGPPTKFRRLYEAHSPEPGNLQLHGHSMSLSSPPIDFQMQTVGQTVGVMSSLLQQSQMALHRISKTLDVDGQFILEMAREYQEGTSPSFKDMAELAQSIISVMGAASDMDRQIQQAKEALTQDLDNVGLAILVPEWIGSNGTNVEESQVAESGSP